MYLKLAESDPSFEVVDCSGRDGRMLPPDEIFSKLLSVYEKH